MENLPPREESIALKSELAGLEALPGIFERIFKPVAGIDSNLETAAQLPAFKRIGEEFGVDIDKSIKRDD